MVAWLEIGELREFRPAMERYNRSSVPRRDTIAAWLATTAAAMLAILHGDFSLGEKEAERALRLVEDSGTRFGGGIYGIQMFTIRREQGRLREVAPLLKQFVDDNPDEAVWRPGLMLLACDLGFDLQARDNLARLARTGFALPDDSRRLLALTYIAEVCARLGNAEQIDRIYALLQPYGDQVVMVPASTLCTGAVARHLGMLAAARQNWPAAERHFAYALGLDEMLEAWPWLAHTRHECARALLARGEAGDLERAEALLAAATATAVKLGMAALLNQLRVA